MHQTDTRFPTDNINLAAALAALHIPVKRDIPCQRTRDEAIGSPERFSFFFERRGVEFCGESHLCEHIRAAWDGRSTFERRHPQHPLVAIRSGLDARDWINRAANGEIACGPSRTRGAFETGDIILAACWKASGGRVLEIVDGMARFDKAAPRSFTTQFERWNTDGHKETPVALRRRALECRAVLKRLYVATRSRIRRVIGDPEDGDWSVLLYPDGATEAELQAVQEEIA